MNVQAVLEKMEDFTSIVMSVQDVSSIHGNIVLHVSDVLFRIIVAIAKKRSKKCEIKVQNNNLSFRAVSQIVLSVLRDIEE